MPITEERQTIQDLRAVGFTEQQAMLLAAKLETTAQATSQDLKSFISAELERLRAELERLRADIEVRFAQIEARFERSLRVLLVAILSAYVGVTALAVAIIKLVP